MRPDLSVTLGQFTSKGRKEVNQDFFGALIPRHPVLGSKGLAVVIADGISSSNVSHVAAQSAVKSFLTDYYSTPDTWTVRTSAQRVISAVNAWLHAQTRRGEHRYDIDKGYVCTFSAIVFKGRIAHVFHVGDARIYRISGQSLDQLTNDHRLRISADRTYLSRALGMDANVEIEWQAYRLERGDIFVLATDGVYEHVSERTIIDKMREHAENLDAAARALVEEALDNGSKDNLTVQIARLDGLPDGDLDDTLGDLAVLAPPPLLEPRTVIDGFKILRTIHSSARSHVYLAEDIGTGEKLALKIPSIDLRGDAHFLKRFMLEEWISRRIDSNHVLKAHPQKRTRSVLYTTSEFVDGQTLTQWMIDNPQPDLERIRVIVEQIASGLRAFHRLEMLHQDLRPDNVMIDKSGVVKIIDFGSARVAGVIEASPLADGAEAPGTHQYMAPEYFLGEDGTTRSDLYSLGVIAYQMLTGRLPYGAQMARARTRLAQRRVKYVPAAGHGSIPAWINAALRQAVDPDPARRQQELSEFTHALRVPPESYFHPTDVSLLERNPVLFWQVVSFLFAAFTALLILLR